MKKASAMDFLIFRNNALQNICLMKNFPPNYWSKDDLESWIKKEWERHQKHKKIPKGD